mmetsp:Transcript_992/g.1252  ORF Transcript_992/g.1252 Transcript_992/m.1252 type:complete len:1105 (-) Transcript_992:236-3550(-)|eukprot:CAMPEP_0117744598 /NCGR_PEP_ID=MMETSP0947-20121206/6854_1 /TAXON_ID=44440 /ORGANISM="Chattonella subsalsa, Strain CCMP2191" /LENGTH=1104 /DNA_ID=CAMNT_0005561577 /DNA_START=133 /DNA_END=3447 /DNA_ORIENTATION=+
MNAEQLAQVESLCDVLYNSSDQQNRAHAQQQLLSLQSSAEYIPQCQYILDNSSSGYALLLASTSLTKLITTHWNNFSASQRVDIRNYILSYLASKGPHLDNFVITSLIQLVCRITKLGWFDDVQHREIVDEVTKFLQATVDHCIIGLKILNALVGELNLPTSGRTLPQHRKTAVSFRDVCLLAIFQISLTTLRQLSMNSVLGATPEQERKMRHQALSLSTACLSFDFIGTNPDESADDIGTIQVPSSWRNVIQDAETMTIMFDFYKSSEPEASKMAMQSLILLAAVRRSLFPTDKERGVFLQRMMAGIREVLRDRTGLQHQDNYHEFCRLLGRLKANYQLSELVRTEGYIEWLELASSFSVQSFQQWQWSTNSIHYLLALWGRLVAAVPYVRPDAGARNHLQCLQTSVMSVVQAYIKAMIDSVEVVLMSDGTVDDPLEDEGSLREQLDRLPVVCRFQYESVAQFILTLFDPAMQHYQDVLSVLTPEGPAEAMRRAEMLEGQLTWLVYIVGAVIGGYSLTDTTAMDGEETIDASLSRRVLQLAQGVDFRLSSTGGRAKCQERLELALLYYMQTFRRQYMNIPHHPGSSSLGSRAPILAMVGGSGGIDYQPSLKQEIFQRMFEHLGLGDHTAVVNIVVTKIGNNLKYWPDSEEIIGRTLSLFLDMASGYSTKLLLSLDTVQYLLLHHTPEHFPFLGLESNMRHRTTFHTTLVRLIFSNLDEMSDTFDSFMEPILTVMGQLNNTPDLRQESVRAALIGICRDLRGITAASNNRRTYAILFEMVYPTYFPVFARAAEIWYDTLPVMTSLLKFLQEFVFNKAQRLVFEQSSPNGILLFRETSKIIVAYGSRLGQVPVTGNDLYKEKYKGITMILNVLTTSLSGNYVNFGVFALYNDKALEDALNVALELSLSVPVEEVISYPKFAKAYFAFFEILFRNHTETLLALETPVFLQIIKAQHDGITSLDTPLAAQCANTIDHLATYFFKYNKPGAANPKPGIVALNHHLNSEPTLLSKMMATLFNQLLFGPMSNQWAVTRPILSLMLASEQAFTEYKASLLATQSPENQQQLTEAFNKLLLDVQRNLENANRDRFTQKLAGFRLSVRSFLTM